MYGGFTTKLRLAVEQGQRPMPIVIAAGQCGARAANVSSPTACGRTGLTDRETMQSPTRALLALSTRWEDENTLDPVYYQELLIESPEPRDFRAVPAAVHGVQLDLALGNVNFAEYAGAAAEEPDHVLRPI